MKKLKEIFIGTFFMFGLIIFFMFISSLFFNVEEGDIFYWKKSFLSVMITSFIFSLFMPTIISKVNDQFINKNK
jgi:uncharacterized protein YacL